MPHVPDDELLSALLDGHASREYAAHVAECAACQARGRQLRTAARALAAPVAAPAAKVRDAAVARALASRNPSRRLSALSAAAVLAVALGVGALVITQVGKGSGTHSTATDQAALATTTIAQSKFAAAPASGAADAAVAPSTDTDLGRVDDISVVSQRSTSDLNDRAAAAETATTAPLPCPPKSSEQVIWHATLNYRGTPAVATVRIHSASKRITEIRKRSGCALLATQEFEPTQ